MRISDQNSLGLSNLSSTTFSAAPWPNMLHRLLNGGIVVQFLAA